MELQKLTEVLVRVLPLNRTRSLRMIYRGHSIKEHRLVPTSLRTKEEHPDSHNKLWAIAEAGGISASEQEKETELMQRKAELKVAQLFYQYCERAGLPVPPVVDHRIREELLSGLDGPLAHAVFGQNPDNSNSYHWGWPPKDLFAILGLAQHYGLPTPLLDWSYSPFVAAYFAASGALNRLQNGCASDSLATVWAATGTTFDVFAQVEGIIGSGKPAFEPYPARLVQPPAAENPNLLLQRGVFTVILRREKPGVIDRRDLPEILHSFATKYESQPQVFGRPPIFFNLQFEIGSAPEILRQLGHLGFSANRIFDGYRGAAKAVIEDSELFSYFGAKEKVPDEKSEGNS